MSFLHRIGKNINGLNMLLTAAIVALVVCLFRPPASDNRKAPWALPAPSASQETTKTETGKSEKNGGPSPADFAVVAENNLFHGERRIPPEKTEAALPKPEIVLHGTIINDEMSLAFIEDKKSPKTTPGRGRRQTTLRKGEVISGFQLTRVENDRIVLVRGEEMMTVHLMDSEKRRDGGQTPAPGARVPASRVSAAPVTQSLPPPVQRQPTGIVGGKGQPTNLLTIRGGR